MAGDKVDLDEFAYAHLPSLRRTAYLLCGSWADADDLTQDVLVRLATSIRQVRDPAATLAYARKTLFRVFLDSRRRPWRRETPVEEVPAVAVVADRSTTVDERRDLVEALRGLPPRQRATLVCRYLLDMDVADVALALGCSEGTVKSQTARALNALQLRAGQFGEDPAVTDHVGEGTRG